MMIEFDAKVEAGEDIKLRGWQKLITLVAAALAALTTNGHIFRTEYADLYMYLHFRHYNTFCYLVFSFRNRLSKR